MRNQIKRLGVAVSVLCLQSACSNVIEPVPVVQTPAVAATVTPSSPTTGDGVVGSTVANTPVVTVLDANGKPVPNVPVLFSATRGGGAIIGGATATDVSGVARPVSWTLGKTPGPNVVVVLVNGLPPVTFTVTAVPGPAAHAVKIDGDNQIGEAGHATGITPKVKVIDTYGNGVGGVVTVFSVASGGGSALRDTVVTDSVGNASPGSWVLGSTGNQSLRAEPTGIEGVTFSAVAVDLSFPCSRMTGLVDHVVVHSELADRSCVTPDGRSFEVFPVILTGPKSSAHQFTLSSSDFDTEIELRDTNMNVVATNNDGKNAGTNSVITALVTEGIYLVVATSHKPAARGAFDITYRTVSSDISGCGEAFVMRGIETTQMATPADCRRGTDYEDQYSVYLRAGEQVTIEIVDQTYSGPGLEIADTAGNVLATALTSFNYDHVLNFTAPSTGVYVIDAWGPDDNTTFILTLR